MGPLLLHVLMIQINCLPLSILRSLYFSPSYLSTSPHLIISFELLDIETSAICLTHSPASQFHVTVQRETTLYPCLMQFNPEIGSCKVCGSSFMMELISKVCSKPNQITLFYSHLCPLFFCGIPTYPYLALSSLTENIIIIIIIYKHCNNIRTFPWQIPTL